MVAEADGPRTRQAQPRSQPDRRAARSESLLGEVGPAPRGLLNAGANFPLSPGDLLALQRTHGNQAVQRLLAQRTQPHANPSPAAATQQAGPAEAPAAQTPAAELPDPAHQTSDSDALGGEPADRSEPAGDAALLIQRLTGYEAEANIPIYSDYNLDSFAEGLTEKGQKGYTEDIGVFLGGGLKYGFNYGQDPLGHFSISADHNPLRKKHKDVIDRLIITGYLKDGYQHRNMSNIEYITPPRDELSPGAKAVAAADIEAVRKHHEISLKVAQSQQIFKLPEPAINLLSGVPRGAFKKWVDPKDQDFIGSALDAFEQAIDAQLYLQETSGVLPEDIPALYAETAEEFGDDPGGKFKRAIQEVMAKSPEIARAAYQQSTGHDSWTVEYTQHGPAIIGYLALVASSLLAESLAHTDIKPKSTTEKNFLALFPRAKLHTGLAALPASVRPNEDAEYQPWKHMFQNLSQQTQRYGVDYWVRQYTVNKVEGLPVFFTVGEPEDLLQELAEGLEIQTIDPNKDLNLDKPHPQVEEETEQQGIPLEDRFVNHKTGAKITDENLDEIMAKRFARAIARNIKHVPEGDREEITKAIGKPPPLAEVIKLKSQHMSKLIGQIEKSSMSEIGASEELGKSMKDDELQESLFKSEKIEEQMQKVKQIESPDEQAYELEKLEHEATDVYAKMNVPFLAYINKDREEDKKVSAKGARADLIKGQAKKIAAGKQKLEQVKLDWISNKDDREDIDSLITEANEELERFKQAAQQFNAMSPEEASEPGSVQVLWQKMDEASTNFSRASTGIHSRYERVPKKGWFRRNIGKIAIGAGIIIAIGVVLAILLL